MDNFANQQGLNPGLEAEMNPALENLNGGDQATEGGDGGAVGVNLDKQGPQDAFNILPKKVWKKVFINLKECPGTLKNLSETCLAFQRLVTELNSKRPSHLKTQLHKGIQALERTGVFLRNCRTLAVNSERNLIRIQQGRGLIWFWIKRLINSIRIEVPEELDFEQSTEYVIDALTLLPALRNHLTVVYLDMTYRCMLATYVEAYDVIGTIIRFLPNVKEITVYFYFFPPANREWEKERVVQFNRYVAQNPLPQAPRLVNLLIGGESVPLSFLVEIAYRFGKTLEKLRINHAHLLEEVSVVPDLDILHFPRLQFLDIAIRVGGHAPALLIKAPNLVTLAFYMACHLQEESEISALEQALEILDNFPGISCLFLDVCIPREMDMLRVIQRYREKRYSSVRHFCLKRWKYRVPLQFFAGLFPNLDYMEIYALIREQVDNLTRLKEDPDLLLIQQERLEESGIWRKLPRLALITTVHPHGPVLRNYRASLVRSYQRPGEMGGALKDGNKLCGMELDTIYRFLISVELIIIVLTVIVYFAI